MRSLIITVSLVASLAVAAAAQQQKRVPLPSVELPADLSRVLTDYENAYRVGGVELAKLFTEDGFVLPGGRPPIRGRAEIAEYYGGARGPLALRAIAFEVSGSFAFIIGGYAQTVDDPDAGKFTLTLRKGSDGRWLIFSDMDNSNGRSYDQAAIADGDEVTIFLQNDSVIPGIAVRVRKQDGTTVPAFFHGPPRLAEAVTNGTFEFAEDSLHSRVRLVGPGDVLRRRNRQQP